MQVVPLSFGQHPVSFEKAYEAQQYFHIKVSAGECDNTVIVVEHSPIYTAGRRTRKTELEQLSQTVIPIDRGGKITWHGPGQLVVYPIVKLPQPLDVVAYVRALESALIQACKEFEVEGIQIPERSGVWVAAQQPPSITNQASNVMPSNPYAKLAAIGVRVKQNTTMHGIAVNCSNSLAPFDHIIPCGISDASVTSLSQQTGVRITPQDAYTPVISHLVSTITELITS